MNGAIMIRFRRAEWSDLEALLRLIEEGFTVQGETVSSEEGETHRILFSYLYSRTNWEPNRVYLAEEQGNFLAMVGFFPQTLSFEGINIPVWAISPVVTHPKHRSRGIARQCLLQSLEELKSEGIPAVFLWGLPAYYPQIGFVPLLPRYKTKITRNNLTRQAPKLFGKFRPVNTPDLVNLSTIYNLGNRDLWLQPQRNLSWWREQVLEMDIELANLKEVCYPKKENFKVWENTSGEVSGYLNIEPPSDQKKVIVNETAAKDFETASAMLAAFARDFLKPDQTLYIRGTPANLVNCAAYKMGGTHLNPAPLAGMVKVIDWPGFLNRLLPVCNQRLSGTGLLETDFGWCFHTGPITINLERASSNELGLDVTFNPKTDSCHGDRLTRIIFGLYDDEDLQEVSPKLIIPTKILFPSKHPFIWDANYLY
jgi:predicted N-acetyltransferase YhbS